MRKLKQHLVELPNGDSIMPSIVTRIFAHYKEFTRSWSVAISDTRNSYTSIDCANESQARKLVKEIAESLYIEAEENENN
jgi:hypothetical protein